MSLEGPKVRYARVEDVQTEDTLAKALELARRLEELLEDTRSAFPSVFPPALGSASVSSVTSVSSVSGGTDEARAHSTRMARAMAASLVDELEALVRPPSCARPGKTGSS